jgi:hypothetical protein
MKGKKMRKLLLVVVAILVITTVFAQEVPKKIPLISFAGGAFIASNKTTTFVGFMGPKLSATLKIKKIMFEIGLNGVPGLMLVPKKQLGFCVGTTLGLRKENWKLKPVFGVMFIKTDTWQTMPGVGFYF